ncbi:hypothetical protein DIS24_g6459 [Lasiodiplodia hormozganensis]|uniref:Uncharacterized protein n=1 Tax=Lasiodiplodia hormozganensis TaxID=869390 RepID=A0AA39YFD6_9PEZI|nr:hypothetical protein DIS24_g6459 [Lasiodiplodia hormozganensis]
MVAFTFAFTALVGAAAATSNGPWSSHSSWGTAASSDSITSTPSASKSSAIPSGTGSLIPSGTGGIFPSGSGSITPSGTGGIIPSNTKSNIPSGTGSVIPSVTGGRNTTETATMTTFTTVTTCPVTQTTSDHGSTFITTTLTTSTITVTSCKAGCNHLSTVVPPISTGAPNSTYVPPTSKPTGSMNSTYVPSGKPTTKPTDKPTTLPTDKPTTKPTNQPTGKPSSTTEYAPGTTAVVTTKVFPSTIVETITSFVPCSTSVGHQGSSTWYSTWLTATYIPHTTVSTCTTVSTLYPAPTGTSGNPGGNNGGVCPPATTVTVTAGPTVTAFVTVSYGHDGKPVTVTNKPTGNASQTQGGSGSGATSSGNNVPNPTSKPHWGDNSSTSKPSSPTGTGSPSASGGKKW